MPNYDELSPRQRNAMSFFCMQLNIEKACAEAGISKQTYYQWMQQPIFKNALQKMRYEIGSESIELLKIHSKRAVNTLVELLGENNPAAVRRAAANDIIAYVLKFRADDVFSTFGGDMEGAVWVDR